MPVGLRRVLLWACGPTWLSNAVVYTLPTHRAALGRSSGMARSGGPGVPTHLSHAPVVISMSHPHQSGISVCLVYPLTRQKCINLHSLCAALLRAGGTPEVPPWAPCAHLSCKCRNICSTHRAAPCWLAAWRALDRHLACHLHSLIRVCTYTKAMHLYLSPHQVPWAWPCPPSCVP